MFGYGDVTELGFYKPQRDIQELREGRTAVVDIGDSLVHGLV